MGVEMTNSEQEWKPLMQANVDWMRRAYQNSAFVSELINDRDQWRELVERLRYLFPHYACDDNWYSCPKSEDGCANEHEVKGGK